MAKLTDKLTVRVNVEGLLQKELVKVVEKMHEDHGVMVENIDLNWVKMEDGKGKLTDCRVRSNYYIQLKF